MNPALEFLAMAFEPFECEQQAAGEDVWRSVSQQCFRPTDNKAEVKIDAGQVADIIESGTFGTPEEQEQIAEKFKSLKTIEDRQRFCFHVTLLLRERGAPYDLDYRVSRNPDRPDELAVVQPGKPAHTMPIPKG